MVAAVGLVSAWLTPRGPLTPLQVAATLVVMLAVGVAAGLSSGSRWMFVVAPLAYVLTFELGRIGAQGATVDGLHLTSMYGLIAFVAGRGAHGLIVVPPLLLGVGAGVWLAHRSGHPTAAAPGLPGKVVTVLTTALVLWLGVSLVLPGTTAAILGPDGQRLEGSVAELATVRIGGVDQVIMLRGRSAQNPVLLHLAGGPGGTDLGAMRDDTGLESDFVVATWEQRGTGKSYATSIEPVGDLTLEQAITDTLEVTDYLRERFAQDRIYLAANSWGTIPAVFAVQRQPERFHAYIGTGQMVNNRLTDQMFYDDTLAWAQKTGNTGLVDRLRAIGPPPYEDLLNYEYTVSYEHDWNAYPGVRDLSEMPFNTFVRENSLLDRINALRGLLDVNVFVYPQLQDYDFRRDAARLERPRLHGDRPVRGARPRGARRRLVRPARRTVQGAHRLHRLRPPALLRAARRLRRPDAPRRRRDDRQRGRAHLIARTIPPRRADRSTPCTRSRSNTSRNGTAPTRSSTTSRSAWSRAGSPASSAPTGRASRR